MIIGIIGGGQLGMMLTDACHSLGHKVIVLEPSDACPARLNADILLNKPYDDLDSLAYMKKYADIITYEFENISYEVIDFVSSHVKGGSKALYISQHRVREKDTASSLGIKTPNYCAVEGIDYLEAAIKKVLYPCILKTCQFGYDGKGQVVLRGPEDKAKCSELLKGECILESMVPFDYEISVLVSRNERNQINFFPISKNIHKNGILHMTLVDNAYDPVYEKAYQYAKSFIQEVNYVGLMAIEMFVVGDEIYFNEFAPRVHNSGHYSIEGTNISQFIEHIKAITNENLTPIRLIDKSIMVNVLGQDMEATQEIMERNLKNCYVHMYGKKEARKDRKMGHITFVGYAKDDVEKITVRLKKE